MTTQRETNENTEVDQWGQLVHRKSKAEDWQPVTGIEPSKTPGAYYFAPTNEALCFCLAEPV